MTLELGGKITIDCEKTKCSAELEFKLKVGISFAFSPVYPTLLMSLEEREIRCSSNILFSILITPIAFLRWRWQCESDFWKDPYGRWCDGHNRGALGKSYSPHCPLKVMSIKDDKKTLLVNLNVLVIQCSFTVVIIWSRLHRNLSRNLWYSKSFCFFFCLFFSFSIILIDHDFQCWPYLRLSVCLCVCVLVHCGQDAEVYVQEKRSSQQEVLWSPTPEVRSRRLKRQVVQHDQQGPFESERYRSLHRLNIKHDAPLLMQ